MTPASVLAFIRLGRPKFLGGGFVLYALGAVVAAIGDHAIDWPRCALGQGAVTAFQLMTHYANDYFDYDADRANLTPTTWSGGSRVLTDGALPRRVALIAALVFAAIGGVVTAVLARDAGVWTAPTLLAIGVLAWAYSAPPLRLCARGLGELDTALIVTGLVPWLGFYLQAPDLRGLGTLGLALVPLALLQFAMLLAFGFSDAVGDAATGKRTLVVRLGTERAAQLFVLVTTAAYLWLPVASLIGMPTRVVIAATVSAPLAAWRISRIADHNQQLASFAVYALAVTALAELIALGTV